MKEENYENTNGRELFGGVDRESHKPTKLAVIAQNESHAKNIVKGDLYDRFISKGHYIMLPRSVSRISIPSGLEQVRGDQEITNKQIQQMPFGILYFALITPWDGN